MAATSATAATTQSEIANATAWTNPGNATGAADAVLAVNTLAAAGHGNRLLLGGYSFSIPDGSTIDGITAVIRSSKTGDAAALAQAFIYNGSSPLTYGRLLAPTGSLTDITVGSSSDTWNSGVSWSDVNGSFNIGIGFDNGDGAAGAVLNIDSCTVTVNYTVPIDARQRTNGSPRMNRSSR